MRSLGMRSLGMTGIATTLHRLRIWVADHGVELRLCFRVTVAAVLTLAVSQLLQLPVALWAVLTAVILTQMSVGRSLKATIDYLVGTLGGAIYAGAVGTLVPHTNEIAFLAALAVALAPTVLLAAMNPRFSAAPFTAVMVFMGPTITHAGPIVSAFERVIEVGVGGVVGLFVSFVVFPARAHDLAIEAAADMLDLIARVLRELFAGFTRSLDEAALRRMQNSVGEAFVRLDRIVTESRHERMTRLAPEPDQGPLLRTSLRLRHDLVMIGRVAGEPLPAAFQARLGPWLTRIGEAAADYARASATALLARRKPPTLDALEAAIDGFAGEMAALRRDGLTRELSIEAVERIFALAFALEQLRRNFNDLARCVAEFAPSRTGSVAEVAATSSQ